MINEILEMVHDEQTGPTAAAVRTIIVHNGDDPNREGLLKTPDRVARFYREFFLPTPFEFTTFDAEGMDQMIVQNDIQFYSLCEHHMVPFFGKVAVAYIPNGKIVGLSKLARCVHHFARRLQNQERMTQQIANQLNEVLAPAGAAVLVRARHLCQEMRGVRAVGSVTTTSCLLGVFREEGPCRSEFLSLAQNQTV